MELTANDIIKYIGAVMDYPCEYSFGDIDVAEFMYEHAPGWCEHNCHLENENATCEDCWHKFFETLIEKGVGLNDHES